MTSVTLSALQWSLERLNEWAASEKVGKRTKQVIYRLFLLRELGVSSSTPTTLSTTDFRNHCRRFLLVSPGALKKNTGGSEHYFIPLTCSYAKAKPGSDFAVGTMWTRCGTWKKDGILDYPESEGKRSISFTHDYGPKLQKEVDSDLLPALPLAIYLLRAPSSAGIDNSSVADAPSLLALFKKIFRLNDADVEGLLDWDESGFRGDLLQPAELTDEEILELLLAQFPFKSDEGMLEDTNLASKYIVPKDQKRGISSRPPQVLIHGCPGSGKSYMLQQWAREVSQALTVVFHPETSYSDFVGVYRPSPVYRQDDSMEFVDEAGNIRSHGEPYITYEFIPGPLLDAYCLAKLNPGEAIALIIEELSRANAALAFGDMLQLLDRLDSDADGHLKGESAYEISPRREISSYLSRHGVDESVGGRMRFPPNLHIWATMNRSDQNARQLDAAFLRRWDKLHLSHAVPCTYGTTEVLVPGGVLGWDELRGRINAKLISFAPEDKFVGPYFLKRERLVDREAVAEDLLGYLWNDVLKSRARDFFSTETFSDARRLWVEDEDNPFREISLS